MISECISKCLKKRWNISTVLQDTEGIHLQTTLSLSLSLSVSLCVCVCILEVDSLPENLKSTEYVSVVVVVVVQSPKR